VLVAGIGGYGEPVRSLEVADPRALRDDELLVEVRAAGVGNWDEFVRTDDWDVGAKPPMALGVAAAGVVTAVGDEVSGWATGDELLTHPLPLRDQGTWAPYLIAPAALVARKPAGVGWEAAGAFPVPALTAEQVIVDTLSIAEGDRLLVHGAAGVTGRLLVSRGALAGAEVTATASAAHHEKLRALGARHVFDYHDRDWPERVRALNGGAGVDAAANAAPNAAAAALTTVRDGGRLATITSDPPDAERAIAISEVYVRPDGAQLQALVELFAEGKLSLEVGSAFGIRDAAAALAAAVAGHRGAAVVLSL
jgi:NADPH:quinone reductase-like Zn-dependent oxidoreductase